MKKILLFAAALCASTSLMAEFIGWSPIEMTNETTDGTSGMEAFFTNARGDIFFVGNASSKGSAPTITFGGETLPAAPYRVNQNATNTNAVFGKLSSEDGSVQFVGASDRGKFSSYAAAPTADGGLALAVTAAHSDSNYLADNFAMRFTLRSEPEAEWQASLTATYVKQAKEIRYGAIIEANESGISVERQFTQPEGQTNAFSFVDMATDGTNYYLLTFLNPAIVLDNGTTISTEVKGGSIAILKFDANWNYVGSVVSGGIAAKDAGNLSFTNGNLYYSGNLAGVAGSAFTLGNQSVTTATEDNGIVYAALSTDLACTHLGFLPVSKKDDGKVGTVTVYDMLVDGTDAYFTGFYNTKFTLSNGNTVSANSVTTAFVAKVDLTTKSLVAANKLTASGITQGYTLLTRDGKIYMCAYKWDGEDRIALYGFDNTLAPTDTIALVQSSDMETVWGAVLVEKEDDVTLAYALRTRRTITFVADPTQTYAAQNNAYRAVIALQTLPKGPSTAVSETETAAPKAVKVIRDGQVLILRGDKVFNALGQQL